MAETRNYPSIFSESFPYGISIDYVNDLGAESRPERDRYIDR